MKRKPFFSLVIPCYNDGRYEKGKYLDALLTNVEEQGLDKNDLEVIIVDDCSPVSIKETVDAHKSKLHIRCLKTKVRTVHCPGNTRQVGADDAKGEWLCFADHDDLFYPHMLADVKAAIEQSGTKYLVASKFNKIKITEEGKEEIIEEFDHNMNFVHGKFYNLQNFWKTFNIHFIEDLKTHEDIAVGTQTKYALHSIEGATVTYIESPVYKWMDNEDSTSNINYVTKKDENGIDHTFLERNYNDWLVSNIGTVLELPETYRPDRDKLISNMLPIFGNCWCQLAAWKQLAPNDYIKENIIYVSKLWSKFKTATNMTSAALKVIISANFKQMKADVDRLAEQYKEQDLFMWMDELDKIEKQGFIIKEEPKSDRPYFSVVIACYNDGRYKKGVYLDRLLDSLCKQGLEKKDLEVILSDDCSPVPFDDIVEPYKDRLIIKRIKTDYNFAPGNTRAKGLELVTGEWLCFADHDDIYYPNSLSRVRDSIKAKGETRFAFTDFNGVLPDGKVNREFKCTLNWCHAKFYNYDNLWKKHGIHFIHDLKSHEDIAICTQVSCALHSIGNLELTYFPFASYAWTDNPQSVSHAKYTIDTESGPREFLEVFFEDYVTATGRIYLEQFKDHTIKYQYAVKHTIEILLYCYFYMQGFQFRRPDDFYKGNFSVSGKLLRDAMKAYNLTLEQIEQAVALNNAEMYYNIRKNADPGSGRYVPVQTFHDWLVRVNMS